MNLNNTLTPSPEERSAIKIAREKAELLADAISDCSKLGLQVTFQIGGEPGNDSKVNSFTVTKIVPVVV